MRQNGLKGVLIRSGVWNNKMAQEIAQTNGMEQFRWQVGTKSGVCEFGKGEKEITGALNDGSEWRCNNNGKMIESVSGLKNGIKFEIK